MYAWVYGANIFSFWNTQASVLRVSVSAAIQKQTCHCSPHPMSAHFQSEWVLASYQGLPWNQTIKKCRWWQNPRWLQKKKVASQKMRLHKDYTVEHSFLALKLLAIYCMLPNSRCCDPWQSQFVRIDIIQQFHTLRATQGHAWNLIQFSCGGVYLMFFQLANKSNIKSHQERKFAWSYISLFRVTSLI